MGAVMSVETSTAYVEIPESSPVTAPAPIPAFMSVHSGKPLLNPVVKRRTWVGPVVTGLIGAASTAAILVMALVVPW